VLDPRRPIREADIDQGRCHQSRFCEYALSCTVERMIRVSRVPVHPDVKPVAAKLDLPLSRLVARLAQTLQLASDERSPVALMRHHVIDHVRPSRFRAPDRTYRAEIASVAAFATASSAPSCRSDPTQPVTASGRHQNSSSSSFQWLVPSTNCSNKGRKFSSDPSFPSAIRGGD
jgi:hypothetical protein